MECHRPDSRVLRRQGARGDGGERDICGVWVPEDFDGCLALCLYTQSPPLTG